MPELPTDDERRRAVVHLSQSIDASTTMEDSSQCLSFISKFDALRGTTDLVHQHWLP
jgi:hypothetical protein